MVEYAVADVRVGLGRTQVDRLQLELAVALAEEQEVPKRHGDLLGHAFLGGGETLVELVALLLVEARKPRWVRLDVAQRRERASGRARLAQRRVVGGHEHRRVLVRAGGGPAVMEDVLGVTQYVGARVSPHALVEVEDAERELWLVGQVTRVVDPWYDA